MLCLKKRRTYSFTQGACSEAPRHRRRSASSSKRDEQRYTDGFSVATLPRKNTPREERSSAMVLTVTEDTPADMLAGSMELLVQLPRDHHVQTQRVTVQRSTPMMDLLVQIATAHKLAASSYTLQAIGERGLVLPHQPNTPIGALDALQVKLLPKQGTFLSRKSRQTNQPFETTFRLQVHLPRNQLYVSRVSPKTNLGEILDEVCREKNLDRNKYELRHPAANVGETLDLSLTLQDYHLQEVTLYPRQQNRPVLGSALSSQDIMALQRQEDCRRQQSRHSVFGFMFKKSKESSLSTDSLGNRSVSPARSDETARSSSPVRRSSVQQHPQQPPSRPQRKRRPAPKPPTNNLPNVNNNNNQSHIQEKTSEPTPPSKNPNEVNTPADKDKIVISHSRNSSDSSGYHEASVLSDNPDNGARMPETLPRRSRMQGILESPRRLAQTSQTSKSLSNLAMTSNQAGTLSRGISNTSLSSAGQRKKRAAPPPPIARPLPTAISAQGLERIVDSDESLTSDMDLSKPSSDIVGPISKASSDIGCPIPEVETARVAKKEPAPPVPRPRKVLKSSVDSPDSLRTCSSPASFGLSSLTEDEREEIAMAIDSIVEAAKGYSDESETKSERGDDVFYDAKSQVVDNNDCKMDVSCNHSVKETENVNIECKVDKDDNVKDDQDSSVIKTKEIAAIVDDNQISLTPRTKDIEVLDDQCLSKDEIKENNSSVEHSSIPKLPENDIADNQLLIPNLKKSINDVDDQVTKEDTEVVDNQHSLIPKAQEVSYTTDQSSSIPKIQEVSNIVDDYQCSSIPKVEEVSKVVDDYQCSPISKTNKDSNIIINEQHLSISKAKPIIKLDSDQYHTSISKIIKSENISNNEKIVEKSDPTEDSKVERNKEVKFEIGAYDENNCEGPPCAIISTIPKCDHIEAYTDNDFIDNTDTPKKKGKIIRSQSEMSHFEVGPAEKHARHLTSNGQSFTFALNTNLGEAATRSIEASIAGSGQPVHTDTDILLQKVSDTLSHSLTPPSPPPTPEDASLEPTIAVPPQNFDNSNRTVTKISPSHDHESRTEQKEESRPPSDGNLTLSSQQDTSDYVSASGEDLSIGDWEYQIPAPPSEFRDEESTDVSSGKPIKNSISVKVEVHQNTPLKENPEQSRKIDSTVDTVDFSHPKDEELKKAQVISELETRINSKPIIESLLPRDESYAPKIAPVENNLSNFTITTYSRPKSLDIFEQQNDNRVLNTFATLARGKNLTTDYVEEKSRGGTLKNAQSMERVSVPLVDDRIKFAERDDNLREKTTVHRSKSYIVLSSNEKFQNRVNEVVKSSNEKKLKERLDTDTIDSSKKFTSLANVNTTMNEEIPRHMEKFSQWRENILKNQEEQTKEKQLQSLQVLKSILPKLKNSQMTEENGHASTNDNFVVRRRQEVPAEDPQDNQTVTSTTSEVQLRSIRRAHEPAKRYTYCGPPSVSLGSWSERPCVNVQIKTDTDYKFGGKTSTSGARTVVSLNGDSNGDIIEKEATQNDDESCIDTTSVNFRELTKTFGQAEVRMRNKPPVRGQRHSEYLEIKENGFRAPPPVKRFTSIVGIDNNQSHDQRLMNGRTKEPVVPKPPTMPIITGVTLKSVNARPKPPPIQSDPRDLLLESIRNFGGREKLKSAAERY